jgi:hypothetical protein
MNTVRITFILLFSLVVAGCATLDEGECRTANWQDLGTRDGMAGYTASRLDEHRKACAEYGIRPDQDRYLAGRDLGLRQYCVFDNAVREGLAGRTYQNVCPPVVSNRFAELNRAAYAVYSARQEVDQLNGQSATLERERRNDKTAPERKHKIREELRELDRRLDRARDEVRSREGDLDRTTKLLVR